MPRQSKTEQRAHVVVTRLSETQDWMTFLMDLSEDLWDLRYSYGRKLTYLEHVYKLLQGLGVAK